MAESLSDRQFETYRRVSPGRLIRNRGDAARHKEEYATAVVGIDGSPVVPYVLEDLMEMLLLEQRRTNLLLEMLTGQEVSLSDVA